MIETPTPDASAFLVVLEEGIHGKWDTWKINRVNACRIYAHPTTRAHSFRDLVVWQKTTSLYWPFIGSPNHFPTGRSTDWATRCGEPPFPASPRALETAAKQRKLAS
jgi:hypothetical protein